jgi:ankyrin repeat protein
MIPDDDPLALQLAGAIRAGDVNGLAALLAGHPSLAAERFGDESVSRTALHIATDWPGNFPAVAQTIAVLIAAGAPVNGRFAGPHHETALHWAASSDDVAAIDALVAAGADIEADGAVLTGGTPLSDAVVFGQWRAARRLVDLGATMTIWQAAALGDTAEVERQLAVTGLSQQDITNACWHACRAGNVGAAQALVARGADIDWLGHEQLTSRQAGVASGNADLITWLGHL